MYSHQFTCISSWFRIAEVKATAGQWFVFTTQTFVFFSFFLFVRYHTRIIYTFHIIFGVV